MKKYIDDPRAVTPPFELHETNHGIDGWDAKTKLVARFSSNDLAMTWLANRGFTHREYSSFAHVDPASRHTMGQITYEIKASNLVPEDPE